jgi:hypothetical protein
VEGTGATHGKPLSGKLAFRPRCEPGTSEIQLGNVTALVIFFSDTASNPYVFINTYTTEYRTQREETHMGRSLEGNGLQCRKSQHMFWPRLIRWEWHSESTAFRALILQLYDSPIPPLYPLFPTLYLLSNPPSPGQVGTVWETQEPLLPHPTITFLSLSRSGFRWLAALSIGQTSVSQPVACAIWGAREISLVGT